MLLQQLKNKIAARDHRLDIFIFMYTWVQYSTYCRVKFIK